MAYPRPLLRPESDSLLNSMYAICHGSEYFEIIATSETKRQEMEVGRSLYIR